MKNYEATGKTYEEALENGLQALGATISDVDITVLEEGSKGLFGLFGSRPYKVRLTLKAVEEDPLADLFAKPEPKKAPRPEKKAEPKPEPKHEAPKAEEKEEESAPRRSVPRRCSARPRPPLLPSPSRKSP